MNMKIALKMQHNSDNDNLLANWDESLANWELSCKMGICLPTGNLLAKWEFACQIPDQMVGSIFSLPIFVRVEGTMTLLSILELG